MIELLGRLRKEKIKVWMEDGKLLYKGPEEALTDELLGEIRDHEDQILALLKDSPKNKETSEDPEKIIPQKNKDHIPLSFAQQRLWFMEQLQPGTSFYNIQDVLRLKGALDHDMLQRSFDDVVKRHESLRTTFAEVDEQPIQVISDTVEYPYSVEDLSHLPEKEREAEAEKIIYRDATMPFDLADRLFRVIVIRMQPEEHILIMSMHHIISDGWSMGILFNELSALYDAYTHDRPSPLKEMRLQYSDYAIWQRNLLQGDRLEAELSYWKKHLQDAPALTELPTDFPRPAIQNYKGNLYSFWLSGAEIAELEEICQQNAATLFMGLLTIYNILLHRHTGQEDLIVGTVTANRNSMEVEEIIGFFVNTLPIYSDLSGDPTFIELLKQVRNACLGAFTHQEVPFEMLVETIKPERTLSYTPLVQTLCILQTAPEHVEIAGLLTKRIEVDYDTAKFDLTFSFEKDADGMLCHVEYNVDLFTEETVAKLAKRFQTLLKSVVANQKKHISELPMITKAERKKVLETWNKKVVAPQNPLCIHQVFENQVLERPDATALVFQKESLTYQQLNERANQLAHYLQDQGVDNEVRVAICVERSLEMIVGILGILKAGGTYVPIDPNYPDERKQYILEDSQAEFLLTSAKMSDSYYEELEIEVITFENDQRMITRQDDSNPEIEVSPEQVAYIIYTSGSTGKPKGVMVPHSNVIRLFSQTQDWFQFSSADKWTLFHSFAFDFSVWEIWGALLYGGQLVIVPYWTSRSVDEFYELVVNEQVTILNQTPSAFYQFNKVDERSERELHLRTIIFGGEALEPEKLKGWLEKHGDTAPELVNMYGITETTVHVTYRPIKKDDLPVKSMIGEKIPDLELYILDKNLEPVPVGVKGEMYIGGAGLARGYNNLPKLTADRFIPHKFSQVPGARLYKTGDLARFAENGDVEYLGRIDHQVKIRGFRIELDEIQKTLLKHTAVQDSHVMVHEASEDDKRIAAYFILKPDREVSVGELQEYMKEFLPTYMIPAWFMKMDAFPLTKNGKIDQRVLPQPAVDRTAIKQEFVLPRNETEEALASIWKETLKIDQVGIYDNFFELGGHSFTAVQLIRKVEKDLGKTLPTSAIFQYSTIEGLSKLLLEESEQHEEGVMAVLRKGKQEQTLSFIHPVGGNIFCYSKLLSMLQTEKQIYGFKSPGLDGKESTLSTIQDLASRYVADLLATGNEQHMIVGWSMGGVIAFEMGLQIYEKLGYAPKIIMIDSWAKDIQSIKPSDEEVLDLFVDDFTRSSGVEFVPNNDFAGNRLEQLFLAMREAGLFTMDSDVSYMENQFGVYKSNLQALRTYTPSQKYPGEMVLLRASYSVGVDELLGWQEWSEQPIQLSVIPGDHYSIFTGPSLTMLAQEIDKHNI